ncbi:GNAT family N-acetyltransferase [Siccibacter turicensis]|uniref:GNAT family N-acetyltransferase n=1 Tax=Siccibacter turicensis TaxID=357233 RepID=A0A2P8VMB0_9ENTR|nr:GNAT family N-acetyltransferase [Siccibacter turicensis]MDY0969920.1 GNAT family N-acetyltransferase [Siccibacter turicensis]PSN08703.1 GNAT family N-acetyltransferase [Siccibacter turicensis]
MIIQPLWQTPQHADRVIDRIWAAFGTGLSRAFFASVVEHSQQPDALPLTFIATEGETLLGTVGLWRCDLISRQDLFPWLAALYVEEGRRGEGIGQALQQHVIAYARQQGFSHLHLYAAFRDYYERFGWEHIGEGIDYPDTRVNLYRYTL